MPSRCLTPRLDEKKNEFLGLRIVEPCGARQESNGRCPECRMTCSSESLLCLSSTPGHEMHQNDFKQDVYQFLPCFMCNMKLLMLRNCCHKQKMGSNMIFTSCLSFCKSVMTISRHQEGTPRRALAGSGKEASRASATVLGFCDFVEQLIFER